MKKKISGKVGIIGKSDDAEKKAPGAKKKRTKGAATMFWQVLVKVWFDVYAELVPPPKGEEKAEPLFVPKEAKGMKLLLGVLHERCIKRGAEWTEEEAKKRFDGLLRYAWGDDFISRNFSLCIINSQLGRLLNQQITPKKDGTGQTNTTKRIEPSAKSERDFGQL